MNSDIFIIRSILNDLAALNFRVSCATVRTAFGSPGRPVALFSAAISSSKVALGRTRLGGVWRHGFPPGRGHLSSLSGLSAPTVEAISPERTCAAPRPGRHTGDGLGCGGQRDGRAEQGTRHFLPGAAAERGRHERAGVPGPGRIRSQLHPGCPVGRQGPLQ